jgi:hypothetical protein
MRKSQCHDKRGSPRVPLRRRHAVPRAGMINSGRRSFADLQAFGCTVC